MKKNDYSRWLRQQWSAAGLCVVCGKQPPSPGRATCDACLERGRASTKRLREERKKAGLCVRCGKRLAEGGCTRCYECVAKERRWQTTSATNRRAKKTPRAGEQAQKLNTLCIDCKHAVPTVDGMWGCEWSRRFEAVPGWEAEERLFKREAKGASTYVSYKVKKCPKFVAG